MSLKTNKTKSDNLLNYKSSLNYVAKTSPVDLSNNVNELFKPLINMH